MQVNNAAELLYEVVRAHGYLEYCYTSPYYYLSAWRYRGQTYRCYFHLDNQLEQPYKVEQE
jgi:hypothetical protein